MGGCFVTNAWQRPWFSKSPLKVPEVAARQLFLIRSPNHPHFDELAICRCLAAEEFAQLVRLTQPDWMVPVDRLQALRAIGLLSN